MNKIIIAIVVLIIVVVGVYYLVFNNNSSQTPTNTSYTPPASNNQNVNTPRTPAVSGATVEIKNFSFSPSTLTVKVGTKVTWTNSDSAPHTIVSDSGNIFNSPTLSSGQSFSFTFTNPGIVDYHCSIHTTMKGKIIVE